ncbi:response regulator [Parabacteroides sp. OttesenSCG-928-N08]|nr:response regulator [Parabacteroides sp. OttesenSCG-928-N08]
MRIIEPPFRRLPIRRVIAVLLLLLSALPHHAYNLRQLSSKEGLSNSAIQSICQDSDRFMWFGSVDGLNVYDGIDIKIFKPDINTPGSLSSNLIEEVWEGETDIIWINTNHGLNRYNKKTGEIESYDQFEGKYHLAKTMSNDIFVINEDDIINYYDKANKRFIRILYPGIVMNDIQRIFIDPTNIFWIVTNQGEIQNIQITTEGEIPMLSGVDDFTHDSSIRVAFFEKSSIYFIDETGYLFEMNATTRKKSLIKDLSGELQERGTVSSIIKDNNDFLVAFKTNGLIQLQNTPENLIKYQVKPIDIYCGIFCLYKDETQDIIWIGTDGQGVYMYTHDQFSMRSTTFEQLKYSIQKPVRALYLDKENNLWIGTKDDGILFVKDYHVDDNMHSKEIIHVTTSNSRLNNNSIYAFEKSRRNLLWIGGDGPGLNYYSFKEKQIKKLPSLDKESIIYVHTICEVNDSTLWLASVGDGIYKVIIDGTDDAPVAKSVKRYVFEKDEMSYNFFFTACQENDSIVWFGNRGYGLHRLNINTEVSHRVNFQKEEVRTINDILSMHKDSQGNIWVGTSFGILKLLHYESNNQVVSFINYNEIEGLPNNTIHGILEDDKGHLWISTNGGIVRFDPEMENFRVYNHRSGLNVFEFSDGAYMKNETTGDLFFGGINGFVTISPDEYTKKQFIPSIFFTGLKIYENEYNLHDFIQIKNNKRTLQLSYEQNFFSVSFIALDYINGHNNKYMYNLENFNSKWIENGFTNAVNFTNISPGDYILHVKSFNGDQETATYSLPISILPPWYRTRWAYAIYLILLLLSVYVMVQLVRRRYRIKRMHIVEKMNQQQKEEIYESKLRFFTNITHEFSTPLTLIYGPCDRILSYEKSDNFIQKYAGMIMKNTERLNALIQELIEFRRIETGHKSCIIERLNITELATGIVDTFVELAESKGIDYQFEIDHTIFWNSDKGCITKILTNLLSNAFKYTPAGGGIILRILQKGENLDILVSNTGKGIKAEDIPYVFDRYRVLENFEKQTQKGFFSRNGLGLAICHNMVKLLDGEIEVESVPDKQTNFHVQLPQKEITTIGERAVKIDDSSQILPILPEQTVEKSGETNIIRSRPTIFVIDDDPEMCWFISDLLSKHYNVIAIENPLEVAQKLETISPHLIVSDIMMPELDGISLLKQIKGNHKTAHIPFILLSAKNTPEEQTEGISAGAEAYIVKPFNIDYFQSMVDRMLKRQNDMKDYYSSAMSAYEMSDGKMVHRESKDFYEKMLEVIDKNLSNPDFSTEELATELGLSTRHLYRKLRDITDQTPANLIKEYRLSVVERQLITSKHSVDEIMYMTGFNNRGSFFRLFSLKFGMTPTKYRKVKIQGEEKEG